MEGIERVELSQPLTPRETQVARLLAKGMRNKQIAEHLFIAEGTAKLHVEHILSKLGVTTRVEAAIWFATMQTG